MRPLSMNLLPGMLGEYHDWQWGILADSLPMAFQAESEHAGSDMLAFRDAVV